MVRLLGRRARLATNRHFLSAGALCVVLAGYQADAELTLSEVGEISIRDGVSALLVVVNQGDFAGWAGIYAEDELVRVHAMPASGRLATQRPANRPSARTSGAAVPR